MSTNLGRSEASRDLAELRRPVRDALARLSESVRSSEQELVTFGASDIARALDGFEAGSFEEDELSAWAEALRGREDAKLDPADRQLLASCPHPDSSAP